jgi:hypothetical protein
MVCDLSTVWSEARLSSSVSDADEENREGRFVRSFA